jgi:glycosyltransferase involved in cell wall biosynthesis
MTIPRNERMGDLQAGVVSRWLHEIDARLPVVEAQPPKVSIIVTNYNYADYIDDCLQSVARQDYPEIECVIVDDCSTDESADRIRNYIAANTSHVSFRILVHEHNQGQFAAFRTGLKHSTGTFITFLDADDLLLPDFVSEHVRAHFGKFSVAFTCSNQYLINAAGEIIGGPDTVLRAWNNRRMIRTVALFRPFWAWGTTSAMMFRRSVLELIMAGVDGSYRKCADYYLCHFANLLGASILIPGIYGCYRRHGKNNFSSNPLLGGSLPMGDMRNHPDHEMVIEHIREHLLEREQEIIPLLGVNGLIHMLGKLTPPSRLWEVYRALFGLLGVNFKWRHRLYFLIRGFWLPVRVRLRRFKRREPLISVVNLDRYKRAG